MKPMLVKRSGFSRRVHTGGVAVLTAVLVVGLGAGIASASSAPHKAKRLSLTSVTIASGLANQFQPQWIAQAQGFYKQQGFTSVNFDNITTSNADLLAALVGGSVQFIVGNASSAALAIAASGAPIRSVMAQNYSTPSEIAISSAYATAHNIPAADSTKGQTVAQLNALKGTHIQVGVANLTSDAYVFADAVFLKAGLTTAVNNPNADVNFISEGSSSNQIAALNAGRVPAIASTAPTAYQPNTIDIQIDFLPPDHGALQIVTSTTVSMIQQHADVVQALVNAQLEGWNYEKTHPSVALRVLTAADANYGITSPEEVQYLLAISEAHQGTTVLMTKAGYDLITQGIDTAAPGTAVPPFTTWLVNKFAATAIKRYGVVTKVG